MLPECIQHRLWSYVTNYLLVNGELYAGDWPNVEGISAGQCKVNMPEVGHIYKLSHSKQCFLFPDVR